MPAASLLYKQTVVLAEGDTKGLVVSTNAQSELSSARQSALLSQSTQVTLHCLSGAFRVSAQAGVSPGGGDLLVEEGDSLDITTSDEMKNCRLLGVNDGSIVANYYGGGNPI